MKKVRFPVRKYSLLAYIETLQIKISIVLLRTGCTQYKDILGKTFTNSVNKTVYWKKSCHVSHILSGFLQMFTFYIAVFFLSIYNSKMENRFNSVYRLKIMF